MKATKIEAMITGGKKLNQVKKALVAFTKPGLTFADIEAEAMKLIEEAGAVSNFAQVPGYSWATCIMKNDEVVHGIPSSEKSVDDGDIITIDVGLKYLGYHLDTSFTFGVGKISSAEQHFLEIGKQSLKKAINKARVGNSIYDISAAMQRVVERADFGAVYQLTGHGIGTELHMDPAIPCVAQRSDKRLKLQVGDTYAIEIMYTAGDPELSVDDDGWTHRTKDGSLSGMFEETVLITENGPRILT